MKNLSQFFIEFILICFNVIFFLQVDVIAFLGVHVTQMVGLEGKNLVKKGLSFRNYLVNFLLLFSFFLLIILLLILHRGLNSSSNT